jgi:hypothetical protein
MLNMGALCIIHKSDGWVMGQCLIFLLAVWLETEILMNEKGKVVAELSNET